MKLLVTPEFFLTGGGGGWRGLETHHPANQASLHGQLARHVMKHFGGGLMCRGGGGAAYALAIALCTVRIALGRRNPDSIATCSHTQALRICPSQAFVWGKAFFRMPVRIEDKYPWYELCGLMSGSPSLSSQSAVMTPTHAHACSIPYSTVQTLSVHLVHCYQSCLQVLQHKLQRKPGPDTNTHTRVRAQTDTQLSTNRQAQREVWVRSSSSLGHQTRQSIYDANRRPSKKNRHTHTHTHTHEVGTKN